MDRDECRNKKALTLRLHQGSKYAAEIGRAHARVLACGSAALRVLRREDVGLSKTETQTPLLRIRRQTDNRRQNQTPTHHQPRQEEAVPEWVNEGDAWGNPNHPWNQPEKEERQDFDSYPCNAPKFCALCATKTQRRELHKAIRWLTARRSMHPVATLDGLAPPNPERLAPFQGIVENEFWTTPRTPTTYPIRNDLALYMITLTVPHDETEPLEAVLARLFDLWDRLRTHWKDQTRGKVKNGWSAPHSGHYAIEIKRSGKGWHPHMHLIAGWPWRTINLAKFAKHKFSTVSTKIRGGFDYNDAWEIIRDAGGIGVKNSDFAPIRETKDIVEAFKYTVKYDHTNFDDFAELYRATHHRRLNSWIGSAHGMISTVFAPTPIKTSEIVWWNPEAQNYETKQERLSTR